MLENDLSQIQEHVMNWHGWGWLVCLVLFLLGYRFYMLLQLVFLACCLKMKNTNKAKSTSGEPEGVRQVREAPRYIRTRRPRLCIQAAEFLLQKKTKKTGLWREWAILPFCYWEFIVWSSAGYCLLCFQWPQHGISVGPIAGEGRLAPL